MITQDTFCYGQCPKCGEMVPAFWNYCGYCSFILQANKFDKSLVNCYGFFSLASFKYPPVVLEEVTGEAKEHISKGSRSVPGFTVLGSASSSSTSLGWIAYFEYGSLSNDGDGEQSFILLANEFISKLSSKMLTCDPISDVERNYIGPILYLEKPKLPPSPDPYFSILVVATAKGPEEARELVEVNKSYALQQLATEEGALRYVIMPAGGDAPGADELIVHCVETWKKKDDYETHKAMTQFRENVLKMETLTTNIHTVEFGGSCHYQKKK